MGDKYEYKTKPFKHQLEALRESASKQNFAYFMEMGCVDGDTEFLTQRGWVKFGDFDLDEWERPLLVAQAVPEPGIEEPNRQKFSFEFTEPLAFIKKPAYEWVYVRGALSPCVKDNKGKSRYEREFCVTKDHTFPIEYSWTADEHSRKTFLHFEYFPECTAEYMTQVFNKDPKRKPLLPAPASKKLKMFSVPEKGLTECTSKYYRPDPELNSLTEWELRFMVAAMADGTFPNKRDNKCDFYFTKERKCKRLRMLAAKAGIPMVEEKVKGKFKETYIFHTIAPLKMKVYDERWYSLPPEKLKIITSEVFHWDGWTGSDRAEFYTVHKDSADFIQFALLASGWEGKLYYNGVKKLYTLRAMYNRCFNSSVLDEGVTYDTFFSDSKLKIYKAEAFTDDMMSYCFRVPSGYLILRRNGKVVISGNSGKTKVMIDNIGVLHKSGHISGALVLAPKGVYRNWSEKEIPTHLPDDIKRELLVWNAAASASQKDKLAKQIKNWDGKTLQVMVFNIESLISEKGRKLIADFIKRHNGNVFALVDESTCIKNHKAKRTKAAVDIGKMCKIRRIATGSPVTNSPLDLYSQCAFLNKSMLGFGSYYAFKNTFADIEKVQNRQGQHYEKILSYKNLDKLSEIISKFSYRVTKKECLDLPDKVYVTRDVELTPEQIKAYMEMEKYQFALLKSGEESFHEMSAQVILTKLLRLHQILCGTFVNDEGELIRLPNKRIEALKDVLAETSGKVIIWATYLADIYAISDLLESEYGAESFVKYYGETSSDDRVKAINSFQDPTSPVRFFLGNVQTAGRGITLTEASTVIYYSNNFSLELRQQSEDRAHRVGQKNNVTYVDLVVRGSLDEKIIKSLIEKRNIANEVLKDDPEDWISLRLDS